MLVIDDRGDAADALTELLRLQGHDAQAACSGQHALESAGRRWPDVVFVDLEIPGMNGFEVARHLRDDFPDHPRVQIVALTGRGQAADRQQKFAASFDGHLSKPANNEALRSVLSGATDVDQLNVSRCRVSQRHGEWAGFALDRCFKIDFVRRSLTD